MTADIDTDVAIIGAGPVGLFAVFELGMLKLSSVLIDALSEVGGQCAALYPEKPIYDIPGYPAIGAQELVDRLVEQAAPFHPVYHLGEQVDAVVRQSPPPGVRVKVGQYVHVALSLGPQQVKIPDLGEKSLRADRIQLLRSGLQVGEVSSAPIAGEPVDTVVMQFPAYGAPDASSSHVDLLVSLGEAPPAAIQPTSIGALTRLIQIPLAGTPPGDYDLVLTVEDTLSGQKREHPEHSDQPAPAPPEQHADDEHQHPGQERARGDTDQPAEMDHLRRERLPTAESEKL